MRISTRMEIIMNGENREIHRLALKAKKALMAKGRFYMYQFNSGALPIFPKHSPCKGKTPEGEVCKKARLSTVMGFKDLPRTNRFKICFMCLRCGTRSKE